MGANSRKAMRESDGGTAVANIIDSFEALRAEAAQRGPLRVAVVAAESGTALEAVALAAARGIATPVLVGEEARVRERIQELEVTGLADAEYVEARGTEAAAKTAVAMARGGEVAVLLKGAIRTDELLHAVLDRAVGLRTGRLLSDVLLYEDTLSGTRRLVGVTDGGINVRPDAYTMRQIVANAISVFHALGHARPKVALLSATEVVTPAVPSTVLAREIADFGAGGALGECDLAGPLALDNALLEWAARAKKIEYAAAGRADIMVAPCIEAGNILGKAVKYLGGSSCAHVVIGASVPVLIPSRVESAEDKLNSVALGVVVREE